MKKNQNLQTSRGERSAYGVYFFGQNVIFMIVTAFLSLYFTDIGITPFAVAIIFGIAKVWDAINDPIFGILIDKLRLKGGRFIPWIRLSTIAIPIFTFLLFFIPSGLPMVGKAIWGGIMYVLWDLAYTLCDAPIFALATVMTSDISERTSLISNGRFMATIGMLLTAVVSGIVRPMLGWTLTVGVFAIISLITMLPIVFVGKERCVPANQPSTSMRDIFEYLASNKFLFLFFGAIIIMGLTNTVIVMGAYFARECLGNESLNGLLMMLTMVPMVFVAPIIPIIAKKVDKFYLFMIGLAITVIAGVVQYFVGYSNFGMFIIISIIKSIGFSITMIMMFMFSADCVEYGEYKTNKRAEGITFSIQTFATKLYTALSSVIGMALLGLFGFVSGTGVVQPQSAVAGIWFLYSIFPSLGSLVAFVFLLFTYKLRDKDVQIMSKINQHQITKEEGDKLMSRKY